MDDRGRKRTPTTLLVALGLLAALLFVATGVSLFIRGAAGVISTAGSAFGLMLLASAARRTRPSRLWFAILVGSLAGCVAGVLIVRDLSLQPRHYWNQWAVYAMPIGAICGSVVAASEWVAAVLDRL